jgi:hypothetical protein
METLKVYEPRVHVVADEKQNHIVLTGGERVTEQVNPADSWGSVGATPVQANWSIFPPSTQTITDRFMKVRCYLDVTVDADLQLGTNDALRQYPISSILEVATVQVNGESISDNVGEKVHALHTFGDRTDWNKSCSMTPCYPDNYQEYADWATYGSAKNPLSNYGENGAYDPRGGFPVNVISPTRFQAVVTEPLMLSPFFSGQGRQEEGFVNVNQFNITLRWKSDLTKVLSHSALGNAITSVTVSFYRAPEILTTFITPALTQPIPSLQILPYHKITEYVKGNTPTALAAGASTTLTSDSIKLNQVPRKMYVYVKHSRDTSDYKVADSFLAIDSIDVLWNNQSGLLSNATQQDLYEISRRCGSNLSYPQWTDYRGSVFCAEFGRDIGLSADEAPGVQGQYTLRVTTTVTNKSSSDFTGDYYLLILNEGTFSISENMARASLGNLTPADVLQAKEGMELHPDRLADIEGGGFFTKLKNVVSKVRHGAIKGLKLAERVAPVAAAAFPELAPIAAGARSARKALGGRPPVGGRLRGGDVMRRRR